MLAAWPVWAAGGIWLATVALALVPGVGQEDGACDPLAGAAAPSMPAAPIASVARSDGDGSGGEVGGALPGDALRNPYPIGGRLGFALNVHRVDDPQRYFDAIDAIRDLGANSLLVLTPLYQENGDADAVEIDPQRCPTRGQLRAVLEYARREAGLRTFLMPVVLMRTPRSNEWRGKIAPNDWDAWWASYESHLLRFAALARDTGADTFAVGSELNSTEAMTQRWTTLIAKVRGVFPGTLTYSANWDRYQKVPFWSSLDAIAVSSWYEIAADASAATDEQLAARWNEIREQMMTFAAKQGRPLMISEVGYPTVPWALKDPWNYIARKDTMADPLPQRRGFEAFFTAWNDACRAPDSPFAGFYCYEWDVHRAGGPDDYHYGVRGKPAMEVIRRWLAQLAPSPNPAEAHDIGSTDPLASH